METAVHFSCNPFTVTGYVFTRMHKACFC